MSQRFAFRGDYAMRVMKDGKGKTLAYFNVVDTEIGVEFRDMRLVDGKNGIFVGGPSRSYKDKEGNDKHSEYIRTAYSEDGDRDENGAAYFDAMAKAAYAFYQTQGGAGSGASSKAQSSAPARRSARGPVPTVGSSDNSSQTGKKLPF